MGFEISDLRIKFGLRGFATSWLIVLVVCCAPGGVVMGQGRLELEPPKVPGEFYQERYDELMGEWEGKTADQGQTPGSGRLGLEARRNFRTVAMVLWRMAREGDQSQVHLAALYAMTIRNSMDELDAMTERLAAEATAMLPPEATVDAERLAALVAGGEALEEFNRLSVSEPGDVTVDAYLQEVLKPVAVVSEVMGEGVMAVETQQAGDEPAGADAQVTAANETSNEAGGEVLEALRALAAARMADGETRENGGQLLRYVDELAGVSAARRSAPATELPIDLRKVRRKIEANFDEAEATLYDELPELMARPDEASSPRWVQPVTELETMLRLMVYLDRVPDWIARMTRFNTQTSRGLYQQMKRIAEDLLDPMLGAGAALALGEMQNQLALFEQMPMEPALGERPAWVEQMTGNRSMAIMQQMTILRSQWAAAWATGADPTAPGNKLLLIRRVLAAMNEAQAEDFAQRMERLNRWWAWEVEPETIAILTAELPGQIEQAAELIVGAKWEELAALMDEVDRQTSVARLANMLSARLDEQLSQQPGGVAGMLSQSMSVPAEGGFGVGQREAMAELCVYLAVGQRARERGDSGSVNAMMEYAGQLAGTIAAGIEAGN